MAFKSLSDILKVLDLPVDNVLLSLYRNTNNKVFDQH